MPKGLKVHANERIDLPDFEHGTRDYVNERIEMEAERFLLDSRGRILDGFRVEVSDQSTAPGQFTVYNGNAFDRDGRRLTNEDQDNASRTATLSSANTTYYVEVEFVESDSDTDARAFWDPTYNNGSTVPYRGKEFAQNVATRVSYDWRIVTPISTTGFQSTTSANSTRVPVAVLTTNTSGEIDGSSNPGMSLVPVASVMESDAASGDNFIRVADARFFPDSGTVTIGAGTGSSESRSISSVDRRNGIINLTAVLTNDHSAGEIIRMSGTGLMVEQNQLPTSLNDSPSTHPDKRRLFFQADEYRGGALFNYADGTGRTDLNLRSEKDYKDFIAAMFREVRWGAPNVGDNSQAPPTAFSADVRYYDHSGGIAGSRTASVTIGDGTTSWGDFNGTDDSVFTAAVAALPSNGGIVFVKKGTYTFSNTVTVGKPVRFLGEGRNVTILNKGDTDYIFDVTLGSVSALFEISHLQLGLGGSATDDNVVSFNTGTFLLNDANFLGRVLAQSVRVRAKNSRFINSSTLSVPSAAFQVVSSYSLSNSMFEGCDFQGTSTNAASCAFSVNGTAANVTFDTCTFSSAAIGMNFGSSGCSGVNILNCSVSGTGQALNSSGSWQTGALINSYFTTLAASNALPTVNFNSFLYSRFESCVLTTVASGTTSQGSPHRLMVMEDNLSGSTITGCQFLRVSGSYVEGIWLSSPSSAAHLVVSDCSFIAMNRGLLIDTPGANSVIDVTDCAFDGVSGTDTYAGLWVSAAASSARISVKNCTFKRLASSSNPVYGVFFESGADTSYLLVNGCTFDTLSTTGSLNCEGIRVEHDNQVDASITSNHFKGISTTSGSLAAVRATGSDISRFVVSDNLVHTMTASSGTTYGLRFALLQRSSVANNAVGTLTGTGQVYAIAISNGDYMSITGNVVEGQIAVGQGSYVSINDNVCTTALSSQDACISYSWSGTETSVSICNNTVAANTGTDAGIHLVGASNQMLRAARVIGNSITSLNATIGILVAEGLTEGLVIKGNSVVETVFNDSNGGIYVNSSTARGHVGLVIAENSIIGVSADGDERGANGFGISVTKAVGYTISGNSLVWNRDAAGSEGISISVNSGTATDLMCGAVTGNSVLPDGTGEYEIYVNSSEAVVSGNVVSHSSTAGQIYLNGTSYSSDHSNVGAISTTGTYGHNHV